MFDSLDEQMKHDEQLETSRRERIVKWLTVGAVSIALFGGLVLFVRMLE